MGTTVFPLFDSLPQWKLLKLFKSVSAVGRGYFGAILNIITTGYSTGCECSK